ncbi:MAG: thiamine pyrophosphate-binding protein [Syntrophaceae bacterium]
MGKVREQITGGHLVAKYLKEVEKVDLLFTLSGGHIEQVLDGCMEYGIRCIDVRHEQAAAMAAEAWSVFTGRPGVCLVTAGPGFTNTLTGITNAFLDNAPLVVLSGRHPLRDDLKGALQELNQIDMARPVVKWCATCSDPKRIPEYLSIAFRQAVEGRPGPVFLELPPDVVGVKIPVEDAPLPAGRAPRHTVVPADEELRKAAGIINSAKAPMLIGGSGVGFSGAGKQLGRFIDKANIPFMLLGYGRGELPDDHPLSLWEIGSIGMMFSLSQADVVIAAGIRLNWFLQSGQVIPPQCRVVRIDIDPYEIDRNRQADAGLFGDAASVLERLTPLIAEGKHSEWLSNLRAASRTFIEPELKLRSEPTAPGRPIHPVRLVEQVQKAVGKDAIYLVDGGDTSYFGAAGFISREKAGVLATAGGLLGCLGTGIPFGLAAKLARPDKTVVVFNGDGAFGFNGFEFDTAVRHNIPIICVVNNDCAWGMIKHFHEVSVGKKLVCTELGVRHYERVVEALGGYGEFVERDEDIIPAVQRAIQSGKPACINVMTDPGAVSPTTPLFYQSLKME